MTEPPFEVGAVQLTTTEVFPATPVTPVAIPGDVRGTAGLEATDATLDPTELMAFTVNV